MSSESLRFPSMDAPSRLSRRTVLGGAAAMGAALGLARLTHAAAQDASPVAAAPSTFDHPLVGVWRWTNDIGTSLEWVSFAVFAADGTYVEGGEGGFVAVGVWRATEERTAELVLNAGDTIDLGAVFTPQYDIPQACLVRRDTEFYRMAIELDATGTALDATAVRELPDGSGGIIVGIDVFTSRADRMTVASDAGATPTA